MMPPPNPFDEVKELGWRLTNPGMPGRDGVIRYAAIRYVGSSTLAESDVTFQGLIERIIKRNRETEKTLSPPRSLPHTRAAGRTQT